MSWHCWCLRQWRIQNGGSFVLLAALNHLLLFNLLLLWETWKDGTLQKHTRDKTVLIKPYFRDATALVDLSNYNDIIINRSDSQDNDSKTEVIKKWYVFCFLINNYWDIVQPTLPASAPVYGYSLRCEQSQVSLTKKILQMKRTRYCSYEWAFSVKTTHWMLYRPAQAGESRLTSPRERDYEEQPSDFFFLLLQPHAFPQNLPSHHHPSLTTPDSSRSYD